MKGGKAVEGDVNDKKMRPWIILASLFRLERQGDPEGSSLKERLLWRLFWYSSHHHKVLNVLAIIFSIIPIIPLFNILTVTTTGLMNIARIFTEYFPLLASNHLYNMAKSGGRSEALSNLALLGSVIFRGIYLVSRAATSPVVSVRASWYTGMTLGGENNLLPLPLRLAVAGALVLLSLIVTTGVYAVTFYFVFPVIVPHLPSVLLNASTAIMNWASNTAFFTYIGNNIITPIFGVLQIGVSNAMANLTALFSIYVLGYGAAKTIYVELTHVETFNEVIHEKANREGFLGKDPEFRDSAEVDDTKVDINSDTEVQVARIHLACKGTYVASNQLEQVMSKMAALENPVESVISAPSNSENSSPTLSLNSSSDQ